MKYALIGCGRIAPCHIKAAADNNLDIACICDSNPAAMEQLAEKYPEVRRAERYTCYKRLAEEHPDLSLAAVAVSSGLHAEIALYLIERGINVIIEKPIAMSIADADRIVSLAEEKQVKVCACHQNRFNIPVQQLRRAIEKGLLGRLSHGSVCVRWYRDRSYYEQADWRGTWSEDGGCLMNQCIHGIDLLRWCMGGGIDSVYGITERRQHPYIEAEDVGLAIVRFTNGAVATVEGSVNVYNTDLEEVLCVFGEKGSAKISGPCANQLERLQLCDMTDEPEVQEGFEEKTANIYGNGHTSVYADMAAAIRDDRQPYIDAKAGRDALELVLAIYKSAAEGHPVSLPLDNCTSSDFTGRFD